ncbi:MAG: DNA glycosylase AlkZ-like family protein, partial [Candidatus Limnocylindria bacterium]
AEDWLPPASVSEEEGLDLLVRRYFGAFGPAPMRDLASWTGLAAATLRPAVERMALRRFQDDAGGEVLDLPNAPLPEADTPAPVRFLPTWDATLLVQARRTQILPEAYRPLIFNTRTPHSLNTFLVDGQVAGSWRYADGRIELEPFAQLSAAVRRALDDEAERLAAFHIDGGERIA